MQLICAAVGDLEKAFFFVQCLTLPEKKKRKKKKREKKKKD